MRKRRGSFLRTQDGTSVRSLSGEGNTRTITGASGSRGPYPESRAALAWER